MKHLLTIALLAAALTSCNKEEIKPSAPSYRNEPLDRRTEQYITEHITGTWTRTHEVVVGPYVLLNRDVTEAPIIVTPYYWSTVGNQVQISYGKAKVKYYQRLGSTNEWSVFFHDPNSFALHNHVLTGPDSGTYIIDTYKRIQ